MLYHKCKCGKAEYWESGMPPAPCHGCEECGTNLRGEPLEPHDWALRYNTKTGEQDRRHCKRCYKFERIKKD